MTQTMCRTCFLRFSVIAKKLSYITHKNPMFMTDFTYDSELFVKFHSLLLGCAVALFLGYKDHFGVAEGVRSLLNENSKYQHPAIVQALFTILEIFENGKTKEVYRSLKGCCFLVPSLAFQ